MLYSKLAFAISLTRNRADAQDLLHDTWIRFNEKPPKDFIRNMDHYLFVLIRTEYLRTRAKKIQSREVVSNYSYHKEQPVIPYFEHQRQVESPECDIQIDLIRKMVDFYLSKQCDKDRFIWEFYMAGYTWKEVADLIDMNTHRVIQTIKRIKKDISQLQING